MIKTQNLIKSVRIFLTFLSLQKVENCILLIEWFGDEAHYNALIANGFYFKELR